MSDAAEPVRAIVTPTRLEYDYTAVGAHAEFLDNLRRGRIVGRRCPSCEKVYVPARGSCPRCGVVMTESVELAPRGTVTTFCVVNVPSENIQLELPYVCAHILLDGADIPLLSLVQECPAADVHIGMRVEAVWKPAEQWGPSFENIRHFRPSGEPDVAIEALGDWV